MLDDDDDLVPDTEPRGDLDPPRRFPPTAIGAGTPDGEEPRRRPAELDDRVRMAALMRRKPPVVRLVDSVLRRVRRLVRA
jgi:hypothetical protein